MHNWVRAGGWATVTRTHWQPGSDGVRVMETVTMIAFGLVLAVWLYGFTALLMRKPHHG